MGGRLISVAALSATAVATAAAGPATAKSTAAAATTFFARARDIYGQIPAIHIGAIQSIHRLLGFFLGAHRDEAESARAAGSAVGHQVGFEDRAMGGEGVLKIIFSRVEREVSNKQFVIHEVMFFCTISFRVFPVVGLRIITEQSSPEDLPRLESDDLSIKGPRSALARTLASTNIPHVAAGASISGQELNSWCSRPFRAGRTGEDQ